MPVTAGTASDWLQETGGDALLLHAAQGAFAGVGADSPVFGVAVSGGSDSMAMLHLMARVAPGAGWRVEAATVDHGLRDGSAAEAEAVARVCAALGVVHSTLRWTRHPSGGNLMEMARQARYRLLSEWARSRDMAHIAVAHTADDQAETFLIGLSRSAGLDGLAGMRPMWTDGGVTFRRPFLHHTRRALRAYLQRHGLAWCDDPSNDDDRFARTRARRALAALAPLGITVETLSASVDHLAMARGALKRAAGDAFARIGHATAGMITLDREGFLDLHPETGRRFLGAVLRWLSFAEHAPRADALARVQMSVVQRRDATLQGCRIRIDGERVRLVREPRAVGRPVQPGGPWDNRWHVSGPFAPGETIGALGAAGLRLCPDWRATSLPRDALVVTPAVWRGETLIAAPVARPDPSWSAEVRPAFAAWVVH